MLPTGSGMSLCAIQTLFDNIEHRSGHTIHDIGPSTSFGGTYVEGMNQRVYIRPLRRISSHCTGQ